MSADNDADERQVAHGPDEARREFGTAELRDGESRDSIGHIHGNLKMLQQADDNDNVDVPEATLRETHAEFLVAVAAAIADIRKSADPGVDSQLADLEGAARELAACIADGADDGETNERLHEVVNS